jgi:hypothetical protein
VPDGHVTATKRAWSMLMAWHAGSDIDSGRPVVGLSSTNFAGSQIADRVVH